MNSLLLIVHILASCEGRCFETDQSLNSVCRCDRNCEEFDNCCDDYLDFCEGKDSNAIIFDKVPAFSVYCGLCCLSAKVEANNFFQLCLF